MFECAAKVLGPLVLVPLAVFAQPCVAFTDLLGALSAAEQSDPTYRETQDKALATAEEIPQAKAQLWLPNINFTAGVTRIRQSLSGGPIFGGSNTPSYTGKE